MNAEKKVGSKYNWILNFILGDLVIDAEEKVISKEIVLNLHLDPDHIPIEEEVDLIEEIDPEVEIDIDIVQDLEIIDLDPEIIDLDPEIEETEE